MENIVIEKSELSKIITEHTNKLNNMKDALSRWDDEKWTDAEIRDYSNSIRILASILSDLNNIQEKQIKEIKNNDDEIGLYESFIDEFTDAGGQIKRCNADGIFNWFANKLWR